MWRFHLSLKISFPNRRLMGDTTQPELVPEKGL